MSLFRQASEKNRLDIRPVIAWPQPQAQSLDRGTLEHRHSPRVARENESRHLQGLTSPRIRDWGVVLLAGYQSREQPTWCDSRPFPDQLVGQGGQQTRQNGTARAAPRYEIGLSGTQKDEAARLGPD